MSVTVSKNSLIVKMIRKSFWFMGEDAYINTPRTTCGLFVAGLLSGLWHILFLLYSLLAVLGFLYGSLYFIGIEFIGLDWINMVDVFIQVPYFIGMLCAVAVWFIILPCYVMVKTVSWVYKKYNIYKYLDKFADKVYKTVSKGLSALGKILSKVCKPVEYR